MNIWRNTKTNHIPSKSTKQIKYWKFKKFPMQLEVSFNKINKFVLHVSKRSMWQKHHRLPLWREKAHKIIIASNLKCMSLWQACHYKPWICKISTSEAICCISCIFWYICCIWWIQSFLANLRKIREKIDDSADKDSDMGKYILQIKFMPFDDKNYFRNFNAFSCLRFFLKY